MQTKVKGMRVRKLALTAAVLLAMSPQTPYALGLSDAEVRSSLDETLDARIRLLSVQPGDLDQASIRLASPEAFAKAGVERSAALNALNFEIAKDRDGTPIIRVTSSQPIRDPYIDFLIELNWPAGRLVRSYTLLLDPPVAGEEKAPPVSKPAASAPAVAAAGSSAPSRERTRSVPRPTSTARQAPNTYGPTQSAETLWNIAEQVRPDGSITVHQMMIALVRNNPEAFFDSNVNSLKAGYVLRVPEKEWINKISAQEAALEVQRQFQAWREGRRSAAPKAAAPAQAGTTPKSGPGEQGAKLRLVAPDPAKAGKGGNGKLDNELALALETVDATQRENQELRERLSALEQQLVDVQRAMNLNNPGMAQMQGQPAIPDAKTAPAEAPLPAAPAATPKPVPAAPKVEPESPSIWTDPSIVGGLAGALALFGATGWLIARRRRDSSDTDREQGFLSQALAELQDHPPQSKASAPVAAMSAAPAHPASAEPVEAGGLDALQLPGGDIDPVVEADVYLAYRRYQQAESLMQEAVQRDPLNAEYRAKLLEVYYAAKNQNAFAAHAEHLFSVLDRDVTHPVWSRVMVMGQDLCPQHPLFSMQEAAPVAAAPAAVASAPAVNPAMDLSAGENIAIGADDSEPVPEKPVIDNSLDFTWDESVSSSAEPVQQASEAPVEEVQPAKSEVADNSLDFDLGDWVPGAPPSIGAEQDTAAEQVPMDEQPAPATIAREPTPARAAPAASNANWDLQPAMSDFAELDFRLDDGDLLAGTDVVGTKLDLAKAYIDMGDQSSASDILNEVLNEGTDAQKQEAKELMKHIA